MSRSPARRTDPCARALGDPVFEHVGQDPCHSFYWHVHDYPAPIARWNYHPEYELHLVQRSSGRYMVGDFAGRFSPGNLVLTGPNLPHAWFSDLSEPDQVIVARDVVLQFSGAWLDELARLCPELGQLGNLTAGAERGLMFHGERARRAADQLRALGGLSSMARLAAFIDLLETLRQTPAQPLASPHYRLTHSTVRSAQVDAILAYLHHHYDQPISMSRLAAWQDMTPSAFSRFFKRTTGDRFVVFVRRLRIDRACRQLIETDAPVAHICFGVGYRNLSNFNRHFRELTGHTPTRYRALFAAESPAA